MWGSPPLEIPEAAVTRWGARTIHEPKNQGFEHLSDRISGEGPNLMELCDWLQKQMPRFRKLAKGMYGDSYEVLEQHESPFHFKMTCNGSYGYVYMVAWVLPSDEKPEDGK